MGLAIQRLLRLVRASATPQAGWRALRALAERSTPSATWSRVPEPDVDGDVARATRWLSRALGRRGVIGGVYLGLDTLNMTGAGGRNVELGLCTTARVRRPTIDFAWHLDVRGPSHLVRSLARMRRRYRRDDAFLGVPEYQLFLGYSGLVLGEALAQAIPTKDFVAVWGFHDGDLFLLSRRLRGRYERLARL